MAVFLTRELIRGNILLRLSVHQTGNQTWILELAGEAWACNLHPVICLQLIVGTLFLAACIRYHKDMDTKNHCIGTCCSCRSWCESSYLCRFPVTERGINLSGGNSHRRSGNAFSVEDSWIPSTGDKIPSTGGQRMIVVGWPSIRLMTMITNSQERAGTCCVRKSIRRIVIDNCRKIAYRVVISQLG